MEESLVYHIDIGDSWKLRRAVWCFVQGRDVDFKQKAAEGLSLSDEILDA